MGKFPFRELGRIYLIYCYPYTYNYYKHILWLYIYYTQSYNIQADNQAVTDAGR